MGIENRRDKEGPSGEERKPSIKDGKVTVPGVEGITWSHSTQEALGSEWQPHVLPKGETETGLRQTAPLPVFRSTHRKERTPEKGGPYSVEHIRWGGAGVEDVIAEGAGETIGEAEKSMRETLAWHVKHAEGMDYSKGSDAQRQVKILADELSPFFSDKPEESKRSFLRRNPEKS